VSETRPGNTLVKVGVSLLLTGLLVGGGWALYWALTDEGLADALRVQVPADVPLSLRAGNYSISYEYRGAYLDHAHRYRTALALHLRTPSGTPLELEPYRLGSYRLGAFEGQHEWAFKAPVAGLYRLSAQQRTGPPLPATFALAVSPGAHGDTAMELAPTWMAGILALIGVMVLARGLLRGQ